MGRQKSDDRVVPEGRRKVSRAEASQQGKAVTVNKQAEQLELFAGTAESPPGATPARPSSPLDEKRSGVPKPATGKSKALPPMTMEEIAHETNLRTAFAKVAANRGAPGPDRQTVEQVREALNECLPVLKRSLLDGCYRVGDIRRVWIPKASGGQRGLGIPNVIDRIVQQAVHQVLSPHYEQTFHDWSHGFRPGRSCHTAIKQAKEHLETGLDWVVDIDLEKFFDEVNHDRLMSRLEQRIADRRVLVLIRQMLRARVVLPDGVLVSSERGTPQGGPLSPLLSNIVLDELDKELEQRGHRREVRRRLQCLRTQRASRATGDGKFEGLHRETPQTESELEQEQRCSAPRTEIPESQASTVEDIGHCPRHGRRSVAAKTRVRVESAHATQLGTVYRRLHPARERLSSRLVGILCRMRRKAPCSPRSNRRAFTSPFARHASQAMEAQAAHRESFDTARRT